MIRTLVRLAPIAACLAFAACSSGPPQQFDRLSYDYLTKLQLAVANVQIDDGWTPPAYGNHVEDLAPERPIEALRQMIQDRLVAAGNDGTAQVTIQNASLVRQGDNYRGDFAVHMDLKAGDGSPRGSAEARVSGTQPVTDDDTDSVRGDLYALTKRLMDSMNVELEYQIRHNLSSQLQTTAPAAPRPGAVQTQDLGIPGS